MYKFKKKSRLVFSILCFLLLIPFCFFGYVYFKVTRDTATRIQRGAIHNVIASESPAYYDDGATPIGVFFEKTHRKYIHYEDVPEEFIQGLVAAEDKHFFSHRGFDPKAILRAFVANLRAGKVVQGGSTITQQTAKNVFEREKRSYQAKLKELIQAFLLEKRYTKEEILEMYLNQFFVSGYGKGLRIAAQYFFGKEAEDLDLVEAAFIAGSVKGPNRYNPFIKKTDEERSEARRLSKLRKDYVLSNMHKMNFITEEEYLKAKDREIPFKEGKITFRLNVVLDYIREQLESVYFRTILHEQGVDNIATSGISVYTSVNRDIQEAALESLRTHLPLIDIKLNGYGVGQWGGENGDLSENGLRESTTLPFSSQITHIKAGKRQGHLKVAWDQGEGTIDYEGLKPIGQAWLQWKRGNRVAFNRRHVRSFLKNFRVGDIIQVKLMPSPNGNGKKKLMLASIPELEGGVVVMQQGMLKAMIGGFSNRFFNRAADAKRQLGSIFKPIVYTAALQLKWNSLEPLQNVRDMFRFENTSYLPRPDHPPPSDSVSMAWAGVKSENLATVWLLHHLTDHLNMSEFRKVTDLVGLGIRDGESYQSYKERIRDQHGVVVNKAALTEAAFEEAKKEIVSDIIFGSGVESGGYEESLNNLKLLHFDIDSSALNAENPEDQRILRFSFTRLSELDLNMKNKMKEISQAYENYIENKTRKTRRTLSASLRGFYRTKDEARGEKVIYSEDPGLLSSAPLFPLTPGWIEKRPAPMETREVWIDGLIPSEILDLLQENIKRNYKQLLAHKRYDLEILSRVRDFRTLVNLSYVVYISKKMGISTRLDPVLSFPLGPNSISIMEAALAYQAMMTGHTYPVFPEDDLTMVPVITKIVDRGGDILWEYKPKPKKIMSDRVSTLLTEILKKVMELGTGKKAWDAVQVFFGGEEDKIGIPIPSYGKTGTANQFTNSSFVGLIPGPDEKTGQLHVSKGYIISSYVGYDDNRPMKSRHLAIYGSSGSLPIWIDTANAIVNSHGFKKNLQPADLAFNQPLAPSPAQGDFQTVPVSPVTGLPVKFSGKEQGPSPFPGILAEVEVQGDTLRLKRLFEPLQGEME